MGRHFVNKELSPSGVPLVHGDKHRPSDYLTDFYYLMGKNSDLLSAMFHDNSVLSGCVVSAGSLPDTVSVTAGKVLVKGQGKTLTIRKYDGTVSGTVIVDDYFLLVESFPVTDLPYPSAVLDGTTVNYVKIKYKYSNSVVRAYNYNPALSYPVVLVEDTEVIIDPNPPASPQEVIICSFTATSGNPPVLKNNEKIRPVIQLPANGVENNDALSINASFSVPAGADFPTPISAGETTFSLIGQEQRWCKLAGNPAVGWYYFYANLPGSLVFSNVKDTPNRINLYIESGMFHTQNTFATEKAVRIFAEISAGNL